MGVRFFLLLLLVLPLAHAHEEAKNLSATSSEENHERVHEVHKTIIWAGGIFFVLLTLILWVRNRRNNETT